MRYRLLVSLGAVNMILVLLFGSFAQQSAQQSLHRISIGSSSINRTMTYRSPPYTEHIGTFIDRFISDTFFAFVLLIINFVSESI